MSKKDTFFEDLGISVLGADPDEATKKEEEDRLKLEEEQRIKDEATQKLKDDKTKVIKDPLIIVPDDTDDDNLNDDDKDGNKDGNIYNTLATFIKEETGLFADDVNVQSAADLVAAINTAAEEMLKAKIKVLPEEAQKLIEGVVEGVDWDELKNLKANQNKLSAITDENLDKDTELAKSIFIAHLKATTSWNDARIAKEVDKANALEELTDRAKEGLIELKELATQEEKQLLVDAKKREQDAKQSIIDRTAKLKEDIYKTTEIIPGVVFNEKEKAEIFSQMTTPVDYTPDGRPVSKVQALREKNPTEFDKRLNYLIYKGAFDEKPNFDFVKKPMKTQVLKNLEAATQKEIELRGGGTHKKIETSKYAEQLLSVI